MMNLLLFLATLAYLFASIFHIRFLLKGKGRIARWAYYLVCVGFALHSVAILLRWRALGHFPIARWYESSSFFAWAIVLVYLSIGHFEQLKTLGAFLVPPAFVAVFIAFALPKDATQIDPSLQTYWLMAHTSIIFLAYASFACAFGFGVMYLIEEKRIKQKRHTLIYKLLPPLGQLDELCHKCILFGFPLLTLGILIGSLWTRQVEGFNWSLGDPKVLSSLITWLIYALQLSIRFFAGWRGRKTAYSAIVGFVVVLFTYVGVNLLLPGIHSQLPHP